MDVRQFHYEGRLLRHCTHAEGDVHLLFHCEGASFHVHRSQMEQQHVEVKYISTGDVIRLVGSTLTTLVIEPGGVVVRQTYLDDPQLERYFSYSLQEYDSVQMNSDGLVVAAYSDRLHMMMNGLTWSVRLPDQCELVGVCLGAVVCAREMYVHKETINMNEEVVALKSNGAIVLLNLRDRWVLYNGMVRLEQEFSTAFGVLIIEVDSYYLIIHGNMVYGIYDQSVILIQEVNLPAHPSYYFHIGDTTYLSIPGMGVYTLCLQGSYIQLRSQNNELVSTGCRKCTYPVAPTHALNYETYVSRPLNALECRLDCPTTLRRVEQNSSLALGNAAYAFCRLTECATPPLQVEEGTYAIQIVSLILLLVIAVFMKQNQVYCIFFGVSAVDVDVVRARAHVRDIQFEQSGMRFEQSECPICLRGYGRSRVVEFRCGHVLHSSCLEGWIRCNGYTVRCTICNLDY